jgi:hypothetical protein
MQKYFRIPTDGSQQNDTLKQQLMEYVEKAIIFGFRPSVSLAVVRRIQEDEKIASVDEDPEPSEQLSFEYIIEVIVSLSEQTDLIIDALDQEFNSDPDSSDRIKREADVIFECLKFDKWEKEFAIQKYREIDTLRSNYTDITNSYCVYSSSNFSGLVKSTSFQIQDLRNKRTKSFKSFEELLKSFDEITSKNLGKEEKFMRILPLTHPDLLNRIFSMFLELSSNDIEKYKLKFKIMEDTAVDLGGVSKSLITKISELLRQNKSESFVRLPSGELYFRPISPGEDSSKRAKSYRAFGRIIGFLIVNRDLNAHFVGLNLSFFKLLLGQSISIVDFEKMYPEYYKKIKNLLSSSKEELRNYGLFHVAYDPFLEDDEKGGMEVLLTSKLKAVTENNKMIFIKDFVTYYLGIHCPVEEFAFGVKDFVSLEHLQEFTPEMLQLLVCGVQNITFDDLNDRIDYSHCPYEVSTWFQEILSKMDTADLNLLLVFITGSSSITHASEGTNQASLFSVIWKVHLAEDSFPISHTCFNIIEIPPYKSKEILEEKLIFSIRNTGSLDLGMV